MEENQNHPERSTMPETDLKNQKSGSPSLNGQDGNVITLSPMPISPFVPLVEDYSSATDCKQKDQPIIDAEKKKQKRRRSGGRFTTHILTIESGEDVLKTLISFTEEGEESRAICILSANGSISKVALLQPGSYGGTTTLEGQFEILGLNGSLRPNDDGVTKSPSGGLSVSLTNPNGRIVGGRIAGHLVAAGLVQVMIASFSIDHQLETEMKQNSDSAESGLDETDID